MSGVETSGFSQATGTYQSSGDEESLFIEHKVSNMETLAGIALRYNVSVADIKRANGLLSDSALYGRSILKIPTKLIPIREELQVIFAQVAAGFGRDPVLNAEANMHPASAAVARVARTLNIVNGDSYPPEFPGDTPVWCHCGTCEEDEYAPGMSCRSRRMTGSSGGDVELIERTLDGHASTSPPNTSDGLTRLNSRMRRRRGTSELAEGEEGEEDSDDDRPRREWMSVSTGHNHYRHRNWATAASVQGPGHTVQTFFSKLGKTLESSGLAVMEKLKAAANQPALASAQHSLAEAADGVLSSVRDTLSRRSLSHPSHPGLGPGAVPMLPRSYNAQAGNGSMHTRTSIKAGGKDD